MAGEGETIKTIKTIDTHAHVFARGLRLAGVRRYAPDYDATTADYLRQLDAHGVTHGVLVQPSFLGTDNWFMLSALRANRARLRGVAVVDPDVSPEALTSMAEDGVVGIRLNLMGMDIPDFSAGSWRRLLRHIARLGWHVEVHRDARDLPWIVAPLLDAGVDVVVDHFGRPDPALGVRDPGFSWLLSVASSGKVWVKLSGAYRNEVGGIGDRIACDAAPLLVAAYGVERLMWGSDWPHTQFETKVDYKGARAALYRWLPDQSQCDAILGATPAHLFRF